MASLASVDRSLKTRRESIMKPWQMLLVALIVVVGSAAPVAAGERMAGWTEPKASVSIDDKVNINTAGVQELMTLAGIGRSVAEKIVQYREAHGSFTKPEELRRVQGVGVGLWERNRERIVVK
jgi:competence ComEA-like helix-hairpin-helix protein